MDREILVYKFNRIAPTPRAGRPKTPDRMMRKKGDVISIRGAGINRTFTVRKISSGVGVERIFRLNSPKIAKIELLKQGDVRRAKLFYLRGLSGKAARIKSKKS